MSGNWKLTLAWIWKKHGEKVACPSKESENRKKFYVEKSCGSCF